VERAVVVAVVAVVVVDIVDVAKDRNAKAAGSQRRLELVW
jgi:hypothetical protein